jgi:nitrogen fixation protein FixH
MRKMNMSRLVLTVVLSVMSVAASAQPRSVMKAEAIARQFSNQKLHARKTPWMTRVEGEKLVRPAKSRGENSSQNAEGFYVFNDEANGGYVVISGDERQMEVLGYSADGTFDPENIPCGLKTMLEQYSMEYEYLQEHGDESLVVTEGGDKPQRAFTRATRAISPLLKSTWGQSPYYNNDCPTDPVTNKQCVTGCVATAMAQIMYYHGYPSKAQGQNSYTSDSRKIKQSMDFSTVKFDWANMKSSYDKNSSKASVNAVAGLMHACGVAVNMDYSSGESGAGSANVPYALTHNFKYDRSVRYYGRKYHTGEEWEQIIQAELQAGRPIFYSGRSYPDAEGNTSGHAFVLDGYDGSGYYHFNWGWEGSCDNYYLLSSLTPGSRVYTNDQNMVCHIGTENVGMVEDPWYADKFMFNANDRKVTFTKIYCYSPDATWTHAGFNGYLGWELKNTATGKSEYGYDEISDMKAEYGYKSIDKYIDKNLFVEGCTYLLYPIVQDKDRKRKTYIRTIGGETDYYLLKVKNGKIEVTVKGDPEPVVTTPNVDILKVTCDNTNLSKMTKNDVLIMHGTYKNTGKTSNIETRLRIWDENMNPITTSKTVTKSFPKNSEITVDFEFSLQDLPEGNYIATAQYNQTWDNPGWTYMKNMLTNFTVTTVQPSTPSLTPASYGSDNQDLDNLSHQDVLSLWASYKNTGKTDNVKTRLRIWNQEMQPVALSDIQTIQFKQGAETKVRFDFNLKDIPEGKYIAVVQFQETWTDNKWHYFDRMLMEFIVRDIQHPELFWVSVDCDNKNLESLTKKDKLVFHATVSNKGQTGDCRTIIMVWNDDTNRKYVSEKVTTAFKKDTETTFDLEYSLENVLPGEYTATVLYEKYWKEGPNNWNYNPSIAKHITVVEAPTGLPQLKFTSISCLNWFPDLLSQDEDLELSATVMNNGSTDNVKTRIRIWNENMEPVAVSDVVTKQFKSGEETTVDLKMPLTNIPVGKYIATIQYYEAWGRDSWIYFEDFLVNIEVYFEADGIVGIKPDEKDNAPIYDLNGRRLDKSQKGINIIGGKKVFKK